MEQQRSIRAVIFDLGGVIVRTEDPRPREELAARFGMTRAELERLVFTGEHSAQAERGVISKDQAWAQVARLLHLPEDEIRAFDKHFFSGDRVDFALIERIQSLRPTYTTAALSNTWVADLPRYLKEDLLIPDTFDIIVSSAQCGMAKPAPEIFHHVLKLAGARPEEAVFVDDYLPNVEAARAQGIHTIQFKNAEQAWRELEQILQQ